jgi:hypothetical protein
MLSCYYLRLFALAKNKIVFLTFQVLFKSLRQKLLINADVA